MNKDTKEALERLEAELLAEEQPQFTDEELDGLLEEFLEEDDGVYADPPAGYQNYANGYRAYNGDDTDVDMDVYSDEVLQDPQTPGVGQMALTVVALVCAAASLVWIVTRLL